MPRACIIQFLPNPSPRTSPPRLRRCFRFRHIQPRDSILACRCQFVSSLALVTHLSDLSHSSLFLFYFRRPKRFSRMSSRRKKRGETLDSQIIESNSGGDSLSPSHATPSVTHLSSPSSSPSEFNLPLPAALSLSLSLYISLLMETLAGPLRPNLRYASSRCLPWRITKRVPR